MRHVPAVSPEAPVNTRMISLTLFTLRSNHTAFRSVARLARPRARTRLPRRCVRPRRCPPAAARWATGLVRPWGAKARRRREERRGRVGPKALRLPRAATPRPPVGAGPSGRQCLLPRRPARRLQELRGRRERRGRVGARRLRRSLRGASQPRRPRLAADRRWDNVARHRRLRQREWHRPEALRLMEVPPTAVRSTARGSRRRLLLSPRSSRR
jgi:hypothetical protein